MNAHEIMLAKGIAYRKTSRTIEKALQPLKLTPGEWLCLGAVADGGQRVSDIAKKLGVTKGMASRQLSLLQERNCISDQASTIDGRERYYILTDNGSKLLNDANLSAKNILQKWLSPISNEDIRIYIRVLQAVSKL